MTPTRYDTLGLEATASADEVARAYRKLALQHHPDRGGTPARMVELNEAYEVLGDPQRRLEYDRLLANSRAPSNDSGSPFVPPDEASVPRPSLPRRVCLIVLGIGDRLVTAVVATIVAVIASEALVWLLGYALVVGALGWFMTLATARVRFP